MAATGAAFGDLHPEVNIVWETRSLGAFGEAGLSKFVDDFDLLVIDHPDIGTSLARGLLTPIARDSGSALDGQSIGRTARTYVAQGQVWALPIDAAALVAAWRPDLIPDPPRTFGEVLDLASAGQVAAPLSPANAFCSFLTLWANLGGNPFECGFARGQMSVAQEAVEELLRLVERLGPRCLSWNPIQIYGAAVLSDEIAYVPYAFGYSNYARRGFGDRLLRFIDIPIAGDHGCAGSVLGGAGLAVSSRSSHRSLALKYAEWVASSECQRTLYFLAGGQPASRAAWDDPALDGLTNGFFSGTRATMESAFARPTRAGFPDFQKEASVMLWRTLSGDGLRVQDLLASLETLYESTVLRGS